MAFNHGELQTSTSTLKLKSTGGVLGLFGQRYTNLHMSMSNLGAQIRSAWGKTFFVKVNINILCKKFSFLVDQRSVQLLYETLDTLIEALTACTVSQL